MLYNRACFSITHIARTFSDWIRRTQTYIYKHNTHQCHLILKWHKKLSTIPVATVGIHCLLLPL